MVIFIFYKGDVSLNGEFLSVTTFISVKHVSSLIL